LLAIGCAATILYAIKCCRAYLHSVLLSHLLNRGSRHYLQVVECYLEGYDHQERHQILASLP
jgi:hypothetical protein